MRLTVVTAIYPAALPFLGQFRQSLLDQDDRGFGLVAGLDGVEPAQVEAAAGGALGARWVAAPAGSTPAQVRNLALAAALEQSDALVLVDCDDVLLPSRVAAARDAASKRDLTAAAMDLVDADGHGLGLGFDPRAAAGDLARVNVYGFSNTTWRAAALGRCLPAPRDCRLMDWYCATRAWLDGASLGVDPAPRMAYRQHPDNLARVLPPFSPQQVLRAADLALGHYALVADRARPGDPGPAGLLALARARARDFARAVGSDPNRLERYTAGLNALPACHVWWSCVAHPALEDLWRN